MVLFYFQKVKKSKVIEEFTKDLARRDKETQQINFYVKTLSHWAHEHDQDKELEKRSIEEKQKQKLLQQLKEQEAIRKKLEDEQSKKLLEQEQRATEHIDTLMIRYGMKKFIKPIVEDQLEKADRIFRRSVQFKDEQNKRKSLNMEAINQSAEFNSSDINDNPVLQLTLRKDQEIIHEAHQEHRRNFLRKFRKNKRNRNATSYNLFNESIYSTGSVTILKGVNFGEVGGLSLAAELTRGLCPNMEALNLKGCGIGSLGVGQIIQGIKFANIMNLSVINLRGKTLRCFYGNI